MKNSSIRSCIFKAVPHDAGVRVRFSSLNEEAVADTERMLNDVGNVRRMGVEEVKTVVGKDQQVKLKKQQQLNNLATQKDVVALSRELLAMHGSEGKASKRRRLAQQLAKITRIPSALLHLVCVRQLSVMTVQTKMKTSTVTNMRHKFAHQALKKTYRSMQQSCEDVICRAWHIQLP